jgi:hypothetical protein
MMMDCHFKKVIMETALSTISILPNSFEELARFKNLLKTEILLNDRDPLSILKQLKFIEKTIADILIDKDIEDHFLTEALKYNEKSIDHLGIKFSIKEVGTKFDYKASGDPVWSDLSKTIDELTEKKKTRKKLLQSCEAGFVEPESGVFVSQAPRSSKTKVTVRL